MSNSDRWAWAAAGTLAAGFVLASPGLCLLAAGLAVVAIRKQQTA